MALIDRINKWTILGGSICTLLITIVVATSFVVVHYSNTISDITNINKQLTNIEVDRAKVAIALEKVQANSVSQCQTSTTAYNELDKKVSLLDLKVQFICEELAKRNVISEIPNTHK